MFTAAIVLATWSLQYLNYKINKINFFFRLFLNIWNYNLSLNGTYCQIWCLLFLRKMLHEIYCNLLFSITCYSNGWKNNFTLALKLTYMLVLTFQLFSKKPFIDRHCFWIKHGLDASASRTNWSGYAKPSFIFLIWFALCSNHSSGWGISIIVEIQNQQEQPFFMLGNLHNFWTTKSTRQCLFLALFCTIFWNSKSPMNVSYSKIWPS